MEKAKPILMVIVIFCCSMLISGCWNYRELDKLAVVAGVAVDKGEDNSYRLTAEIIQISGGKDAKTTSKLVSMEGNTMFDAVRNGISVTGKKLYWSHAKVIIISKKVAMEDIVKIIDWYNRDSETRVDVHILISKEESASELLVGQATTESIKSFELDEMLRNQRSLGKAPYVEMWNLINDMAAEGIVAIAPTIELTDIDGKETPSITGAAVFKKNRLMGFIDGEDTKYMLFVRDEIKGGILVEKVEKESKEVPVSLEIFSNRTKIQPVMDEGGITIDIKIETETAMMNWPGQKTL